MNRGTDHQTVFFADADRVEFGRRLAQIHRDHEVATLAYCLMDNHFHLLLRAPPDALSPAMQHLLGVYTRHTNDRVGRDGPLFRGRFHSIPVETDAYLVQAARYIHRNPLDIAGVRSPRDYRWSSYRAHVGLRRCPPFLDIGPVAALLGGAKGIVSFTEGDWCPPELAPFGVQDLRQLIASAIAIDDLTHQEDEGARRWLTSTALVLIASRTDDPVLARLALAELGHTNPRSTTSARTRAMARYDAEPMVRRVVHHVEAELRRARGAQSGSDPLCALRA